MDSASQVQAKFLVDQADRLLVQTPNQTDPLELIPTQTDNQKPNQSVMAVSQASQFAVAQMAGLEVPPNYNTILFPGLLNSHLFRKKLIA